MRLQTVNAKMLLAAVVVALRTLLAEPEISLLPDDPRILYTGRFLLQESGAALFSWSSTRIACTVVGTQEVFVELTASVDEAMLRIKVDGEWAPVSANNPYLLVKEPERAVLKVATLSELDSNVAHEIEVWKVTEGGVMLFHGFKIDGGGAFGKQPRPAPRLIEFIG